MSISLVLLITIISLAFVHWLWSRRKYYKFYRQLGGPLGLPFLGVGFKVTNLEKYLPYLGNVARTYKSPLVSWLGPECCLCVSDPETAKIILQSPHAINKSNLYRFIASGLGYTVVTSDSPRWNKHRRLLNPAFGRKIVESFLPIFNHEGDVFIKKLRDAAGQPLEICEFFQKNILEVACQTTVGDNLMHNDSSELLNSYLSVMDVLFKRVLSPWLHPEVIYKRTETHRVEVKAKNIHNKIMERLLLRKLPTIKSEKPSKPSKTLTVSEEVQKNVSDENDNIATNNNDEKKQSLLDFIHHHIGDGQLTFEEVRDEANIIIGAATETTSSALFFLCLCLATNPEHQDKLHKELVEVFPDSDKEHMRDVTLDDLKQLTYTEMVINESMRVFAPVPIVARSASEDIPLRDDIVVPRGTQIIIDIYNMHRSEDIWGANPLVFDPERHFGPDSPPQHPYAFIPFTKGSRMCIGYRYAMILMKIVVAKIFRHYRIYSDCKTSDLTVKGIISLKLTDYPMCVFKPIEGNN